MPFVPRPPIRFDDEEVRKGQKDVQRVLPHSCEEKYVAIHNGFRYQRCGGGRRRLAKRSN